MIFFIISFFLNKLNKICTEPVFSLGDPDIIYGSLNCTRATHDTVGAAT